MMIVSRAREFAVKAHGNQQYGVGQPYVVHLDTVATLLYPYGVMAQVVGYLHDVIEDTAVAYDVVAGEFGTDIAVLVAIVTDCDGPNRKARKISTNAKLAAVPKSLNTSLIVKAADRLANTRASVAKRSDLLKMYRKEYPEFKAAVWREGLCPEIWQELDELSAAPQG